MYDLTLPTPPDPPTIVVGALLPVLRQDDTSDHGGAVPTGDPTKTIEHLGIAREGDDFTCGISIHNPTTLIPTLSVLVADGMNAELLGPGQALCGATLIASQTFVKSEPAGIRITSPTGLPGG
jgi:uncharacterized Zn-binding protein involved in type VI secretion